MEVGRASPKRREMKKELKEMLEAGVHFGHKKDRWNPKMRPFIYTERNNVHIFDLIITKQKLDEAIDFVKKVSKEGKDIIFVGTKNQVKDVVRDAAERSGSPYLVERWPGGMLTNFNTIAKRLKYLKEIELKTQQDDSNLTKKERLSLEREIKKLKEVFGGVKDLTDLPAALFVVDIVKERTAVREAKKMGIPVIGIADSNASPDIEYIIPGNDDAVKSVAYITNKIADAIASVKPAASLKENAEDDTKKVSDKDKKEGKKDKKEKGQNTKEEE